MTCLSILNFNLGGGEWLSGVCGTYHIELCVGHITYHFCNYFSFSELIF